MPSKAQKQEAGEVLEIVLILSMVINALEKATAELKILMKRFA